MIQQFVMSQTFDQVFNNTSSNTKKGSQASASNTKSAVMPVIDDISGNLDVQYYGPLQMGTQNQRLTVDIDTGSADLWVSCRALYPSVTPS